jgi:uncharacterized membrane protein YbhN (UPF0104 family)
MGRIAAILVKLGISAALIWYAFNRIDVATAFGQMASLAPIAAVAALTLLVAHYAIAALRVCSLLTAVELRMRFPAAFDTVLVGAFFSQTLISFVGGDAMRIWRMTQKNIPVGDAVHVVLYDRVLGFVGLILMIVFSLPVLFHAIEDRRVHVAIVSLVGCAIVGCATLLSLHRLPAAWRRSRVGGLLATLSETGHELLGAPRILVLVLALSLLIQVINVLVFFTLGQGIGAPAGFQAYLALVPPVIFLSMMPISFAGWGVRESAMIAALSTVGVPASQSVAISICYGLGLIVAGLPGGVLWLHARASSRAPQPGKPDERALP